MNVDILVRDDRTSRAVAGLQIGSPSIKEKYVYQLWAEIDSVTLTIIDAGVDLLSAEVPQCEETRNLIGQMIGLKIDERYLWKISRILGRRNGCRHLYELALEIARAYSNMKVGEYIRSANKDRNTATLVDFKNHCAGLSLLSREEVSG